MLEFAGDPINGPDDGVGYVVSVYLIPYYA
jgi:hypothetical protein